MVDCGAEAEGRKERGLKRPGKREAQTVGEQQQGQTEEDNQPGDTVLAGGDESPGHVASSRTMQPPLPKSGARSSGLQEVCYLARSTSFSLMLMFSRMRPAPRTTLSRGFSATNTGRLVSSLMSRSSPRSSAPPPHM